MTVSNTKPKWKLVEEMIENFIVKRGLSEGGKLPSDEEFLYIFTGETEKPEKVHPEYRKPEYREFRRPELKKLSKQPLVRALDELARKGIVVRRAGAPTTFRSLTPRFFDLEFSSNKLDSEGGSDQDGFGFGRNAREVYGHEMSSRLIEKSLRPPLSGTDLTAFERKAHKALGLRRDRPFLVIARVRLLDGRPRVIHRSYLHPGQFPESFLVDHDFETESLITIFNESGFRIDRRETTLRARFPTKQEQSLLKLGMEPILETEQETHATHPASGSSRLLEYLHACYVEWEYRITNRPPAESPRTKG